MEGRMDRIAVRSGDSAGFVNTKTGEEFIPKGSNLIRLHGDHGNFAPDVYDENQVDATFHLMNQYGYNTVRVFIAGRRRNLSGISGDIHHTVGLDETYMNNVVDFLRRANRHGIYVIFTMISLPVNDYFLNIIGESVQQGGRTVIEGHNMILLAASGVQAKTEYVRRFLEYIGNQDASLFSAILSLQIENEEFFMAHNAPFSLTEGRITPADGRTYDLADPASRQDLADNGAVYYMNKVVETVRKIDAQILVSQSVFSFRVVGKDYKRNQGLFPLPGKADQRYPLSLPALGRSDIDFISFHYYPYRSMIGATSYTEREIEEELKAKMESGGFAPGQQTSKPFIMGEFGALDNIFASPEQAVHPLCYTVKHSYGIGFRGWCLWTFDTHEQEKLWNGEHNSGRINQALAQCFQELGF